jgi:hypothetical protein
MNLYIVKSTNPLYNDVLCKIYAETQYRAVKLAEENDIDFDDDIEIICISKNCFDLLGKPYPEKFINFL